MIFSWDLHWNLRILLGDDCWTGGLPKGYYGLPPVIILISGWDRPYAILTIQRAIGVPRWLWKPLMRRWRLEARATKRGCRGCRGCRAIFLKVDVPSIFYWNLWRKPRNLENLDSYDSTTTIPECFGLWLATCCQTHRVPVIWKKTWNLLFFPSPIFSTPRGPSQYCMVIMAMFAYCN